MTVEEAIRTSIEYETGVRDVYGDAVGRAESDGARRFFQLMADEEQHHLDYLEAKLDQLEQTGAVTADGLVTAVPPSEEIKERVAGLDDKLGDNVGRVDIQYLEKAHAVERETSAFYRRMVDELPKEAKPLFWRFMEIEDGHLDLVQAQLDLANGTGYWFDVREFDLEG
ncbi:MAG: ferritin family protein [Candidatus Eisenbacteria bacterium]